MLSSGPNRGDFGRSRIARPRSSGAITVLCPAGAKKKPPCAPTLSRAAATGEPELFRQSLQQIPETSTHIHWRIYRQSYRANRPVSCGSYSGTNLVGKKISLFHRWRWTSLKHISWPVFNKINSKTDNRRREHLRSLRFQSATADQLSDPQPAFRSGICSPDRNSAMLVTFASCSVRWVICSKSLRDQPTEEISITPSCPI